ncbi:MAG: hypothetical protein IPK99_15110 [Flavobacteriales bacterium]|nr:hypothetical protein [Flavobacteriales bacterium]
MEPDSSYVTVLNDSMWNAGGTNNMDDGGHGPIALPFSFTFFGLVVDSIYINMNGNLSLGAYSEVQLHGLPPLRLQHGGPLLGGCGPARTWDRATIACNTK